MGQTVSLFLIAWASSQAASILMIRLPVPNVLGGNAALLLLGGAVSLAFAFAAGTAEAAGIMEHGVGEARAVERA